MHLRAQIGTQITVDRELVLKILKVGDRMRKTKCKHVGVSHCPHCDACTEWDKLMQVESTQ